MISAYSLFQKIDDPSCETIRRVKKMFSLENDPLIAMSLRLKMYTWRDIDEQGVLVGDRFMTIKDLRDWTPTHDQDIKTIAKQVVKETPSWLVYGSQALMLHDIAAVIRGILDDGYEHTVLLV